MMKLAVTRESWPIAGEFRIARGAKTEAQVVVASLSAAGVTGWGECVPYRRYGETLDGVAAALAAVEPDHFADDPASHQSLLNCLPPGAARNALDCALWDWRAKHSGRPVWQLAGLPPPAPLVTAYTLSLDQPAAMAAAAQAAADRPLLKIKLGGDGADLDRLQAVRAGAPSARLIIDANESWTADGLERAISALVPLGVELIEQPLPAGQDAVLAGLASPIPLCADESCHDRHGLEALAGRYQYVNIKLDKTGGLTEAIAVMAAARALGLKIMVGCMVGTSLAMAPAMLLATGAEVIDLDGPLLLARDRSPGLGYRGSVVSPPLPALWG